MRGDYSRVRFDPRKDIALVQMQQGRVQLDSDWNEGVAALDRRLRAESVDTFGVLTKPGTTGVAVVSPQTPDAFKIEVTTNKNITIGRGRMYVDGLLAENHGEGTTEFDPVLAEVHGKSVLAYSQQPYFPGKHSIPNGGGPFLVYLEVWQRELTYLQDPGMVEKAVGVDTTTRMQTVWQVRLLADKVDEDVNCSTPDNKIKPWQALISPSGGRMSIKAERTNLEPDPCKSISSDGYYGHENQLYRIEIHDSGPIGTATFKWSRDNASVASNVVEIVSNTELKLASLGRDAVLRFNTGDWVEILDDHRELSGKDGKPELRRGEMRQITVDDVKQTIRFTPALPDDLICPPTELATRHTRVQCWNQRGLVYDANKKVIANLDDTDGLIPVPAPNVWVVLENGIQVNFSLDSSGGGFRCGDYWLSAARIIDNSMEPLTQAPPHGTYHHYARLAILTFPHSVTDCRIHWPPAFGGCCTISVAPGESIQAALDSLPPEGGCVCLKTGVHIVSSPIEIHTSHIVFRGESPGVIVRSANSGHPTTVLHIGRKTKIGDIVVQNICFEAARAESIKIFYAEDCTQLRVEHCKFVVIGSPQKLSSNNLSVGICLNRVIDATIANNQIQNLICGIQLGNYEGDITIHGNLIEGNLSVDNRSSGLFGIKVEGNKINMPCYIENNSIRDFWTGVYLSRNAVGSVVGGNHISRSANPASLRDVSSVPSDTATLHQYLDKRFYAIDVEAANCEVLHNNIDLDSEWWGGIRVIAPHVTVAFNHLHSNFKPEHLLVPASIYCYLFKKENSAAHHVAVYNNRLMGPQTGIVISDIESATINNNHFDGTGGSWFGVRMDDCHDTCVQNNRIQEVFFALHSNNGERNHIGGNHISQVLTGITSSQELNVDVSENWLQSCWTQGVTLFVRGSATLINNHLVNCSFAPIPGSLWNSGMAIYSEDLDAVDDALIRIEGCEVMDTGISADGELKNDKRALSITGWVSSLQAINNRVGYTKKINPKLEHRAFIFLGPHFSRDKVLPVSVGSAPSKMTIDHSSSSALVSGNHFRGFGNTTLVEFFPFKISDTSDYRFKTVTFSNNICDHLEATDSGSGVSVHLWGDQLIVMGNHVNGPSGVNAMSLGFGYQSAVLMGNVATGDYINVHVANVTPKSPFPLLVSDFYKNFNK